MLVVNALDTTGLVSTESRGTTLRNDLDRQSFGVVSLVREKEVSFQAVNQTRS